MAIKNKRSNTYNANTIYHLKPTFKCIIMSATVAKIKTAGNASGASTTEMLYAQRVPKNK